MSHFIPVALRLLTSAALSLTPVLAVGACHHAAPVSGSPLAASAAARSFPGVDVVRTRGGGFYVRIPSGLSAGAPLYVIDGSPMEIDPNRGIDWVNLEDVVEIKALKNPTDTLIYGPRAVNGVIILNTRQALRRTRK